MATRNRRSNQAKRARRRRNRRLAISGITLALLCFIYIGGRVYFGNHFFPGTEINGLDCSFRTPKLAFTNLSDKLDEYDLTVLSEDGKLPVNAKEVGLSYQESEELVQLVQQQDNGKWFANLGKKFEYQALEKTLNEASLKDTVSSLKCMNPSKPRASENATIGFNKETKEFEIQAGKYGNILNEESFTEGVKEAMLEGDPELDLSTNKYYEKPKFTSQSEKIALTVDVLNTFLEMKIHYEDNGVTLDISRERMSKFLKWDKDYNLKINEKEIGKYVKERIAKKFDETESMRIIDTPGSGKVYVAKGNNGQKAVNTAAEKKKLIKIIKEGKNVNTKPEYVTDYLYSNYGEIIDKDYVDINLSDQMVYLVRDGEIAVQTPCVTGNVSAGRSTPTGIYRIAYKTTNYTMVKYNAFVYYWMPYDTSVGIGLHDATWRGAGEFGGNTYTYNGSHGCVNLPLGAAAKIYEKVYSGIPVMVHW